MKEMGIKDLVSFVKKQNPEVFTTSFASWTNQKHFEKEKGNGERIRIAIDVPILAYKLAYISGTDALVSRILSFASNFNTHTGTPVFVFDGLVLPEKIEEKAKRAAAFQKRPPAPLKESRRLFADDVEIIVELGPEACKQPNKKDYELMKEALMATGYECLTAKYEAEALCAYLCSINRVDAVLTEDSDAFAYCSPFVILHFNTPDCIVVESRKMFEALQISRDAFIELCVLLGNDFNERIHLVGPVKSLALLKKHLTLDTVLDFLQVDDEKQKRMKRTLEIFKCYCFET